MEKDNLMRQKCMSLPTFKKTHEGTSNISAPFDLYCLKGDHKFPPFAKPACDPRPYLVIDSIVNQADMVNIVKILQFESNKKQLIGDYLLKKGIIDEHVTEKEFLVSLFLESIDYAAQKDFNAFKLACLLNIYISTHNYMKSKDWRQPKQTWDYFKEILIRLTVEVTKLCLVIIKNKIF